MSDPSAPLILQGRLPVLPWQVPALWRLPGIVPLDPADWLEADDAFAAQMAEKARLMALRRADVHQLPKAAEAAAVEALQTVLAHLATRPEYRVLPSVVTRPDGVSVAVERDPPLVTLSRLVQEDVCLLARTGAEHVLVAGLLCFPGSWTLAEKLGRPLTSIHRPVARYDDPMAVRVQRLFDRLRVGQPLGRMNALLYADPALYQPKSEQDLRPRSGSRDFLRVEKQSLVKLPRSGAVIFAIHTYVLPTSSLAPEALAQLMAGGH